MYQWIVLTLLGWATLIASYFAKDDLKDVALTLISIMCFVGAMIVARINELEKNLK
jgi:hypothetical protein